MGTYGDTGTHGDIWGHGNTWGQALNTTNLCILQAWRRSDCNTCMYTSKTGDGLL